PPPQARCLAGPGGLAPPPLRGRTRLGRDKQNRHRIRSDRSRRSSIMPGEWHASRYHSHRSPSLPYRPLTCLGLSLDSHTPQSSHSPFSFSEAIHETETETGLQPSVSENTPKADAATPPHPQ